MQVDRLAFHFRQYSTHRRSQIREKDNPSAAKAARTAALNGTAEAVPFQSNFGFVHHRPSTHVLGYFRLIIAALLLLSGFELGPGTGLHVGQRRALPFV